MSVFIDSHQGPDHRIDQPKECPCCGAAKAFEADALDDDMAVSVGFACGAAVHWRSVFWASNSGFGCSEDLVGVTECPSPGGRGTVQLFSDGLVDGCGDIAARLWWLGYRVQFVPSSGPPAAWFGHYQVEGRQAISDFVDHLASSCTAGKPVDFLPQPRPTAKADIEQKHRDGRDDFLRDIFG